MEGDPIIEPIYIHLISSYFAAYTNEENDESENESYLNFLVEIYRYMHNIPPPPRAASAPVAATPDGSKRGLDLGTPMNAELATQPVVPQPPPRAAATPVGMVPPPSSGNQMNVEPEPPLFVPQPPPRAASTPLDAARPKRSRGSGTSRNATPPPQKKTKSEEVSGFTGTVDTRLPGGRSVFVDVEPGNEATSAKQLPTRTGSLPMNIVL